jgi:hypothetical protein
VDSRVRKAIVRKLMRMARLHLPSLYEEKYEMGKLAAELFEDWADSDYPDFDHYLHSRCGMGWGFASKIAIMAFTYYEIPSLAVWHQVGWERAAQAAQRHRDDRNQRLLDGGSNVLDVLSLI